jgi:hypothetical protein
MVHSLTGIYRGENMKILEDLVAENNGHLTFGHTDIVICKGQNTMAGLGGCRSRIANLPPEVSNATFQLTLAIDVDVHEVLADIRSSV